MFISLKKHRRRICRVLQQRYPTPTSNPLKVVCQAVFPSKNHHTSSIRMLSHAPPTFPLRPSHALASYLRAAAIYFSTHSLFLSVCVASSQHLKGNAILCHATLSRNLPKLHYFQRNKFLSGSCTQKEDMLL